MRSVVVIELRVTLDEACVDRLAEKRDRDDVLHRLADELECRAVDALQYHDAVARPVRSIVRVVTEGT